MNVVYYTTLPQIRCNVVVTLCVSWVDGVVELLYIRGWPGMLSTNCCCSSLWVSWQESNSVIRLARVFSTHQIPMGDGYYITDRMSYRVIMQICPYDVRVEFATGTSYRPPWRPWCRAVLYMTTNTSLSLQD